MLTAICFMPYAFFFKCTTRLQQSTLAIGGKQCDNHEDRGFNGAGEITHIRNDCLFSRFLISSCIQGWGCKVSLALDFYPLAFISSSPLSDAACNVYSAHTLACCFGCLKDIFLLLLLWLMLRSPPTSQLSSQVGNGNPLPFS